MALDFPTTDQSPFTAPNGVTYEWDGQKWVAAGSSITNLNGGGFRNVLINGKVFINQRVVTYAAAAVGDYWADRWKKTAGGMTQVVEATNYVPSATYTLSGNGVTTQQITSPASGNWTIPDVSSTATNIQLELGPVATPFELRPIGTELALCQRYFNRYNFSSTGWIITADAAIGAGSYPAMRATPTIVNNSGYIAYGPGGQQAITNIVWRDVFADSLSGDFFIAAGGMTINNGALIRADLSLNAEL